ncbi:hypothetical protein B0H14DRAFT_3523477 [Mycena olivaceomarginata]|nr:hypothetical protein B0H14DRAFT_3523477 [Mycena olivaceomarginata]
MTLSPAATPLNASFPSPPPPRASLPLLVICGLPFCGPSAVVFPVYSQYSGPHALPAVTDFHGRLFAVPSSRDAATKPGHPPPSYPSLRIPVLAFNDGVLDVACRGRNGVFSYILILLALTDPIHTVRHRVAPGGSSQTL